MIMRSFDDYCTEAMEAHAKRFSFKDIVIVYCDNGVDALIRRTRGRTTPSCYRHYTNEKIDDSTSLELLNKKLSKMQHKCERENGKLLCFLDCNDSINSDLININDITNLLSIDCCFFVIVPSEDANLDVESFVYLFDKAAEYHSKSIEYVRFGSRLESTQADKEILKDTEETRVAITIPDGIPHSIERVDVARALIRLSVSHRSLLDNLLLLGEPTVVVCSNFESAHILLRCLLRRNIKAYMNEKTIGG